MRALAWRTFYAAGWSLPEWTYGDGSAGGFSQSGPARPSYRRRLSPRRFRNPGAGSQDVRPSAGPPPLKLRSMRPVPIRRTIVQRGCECRGAGGLAQPPAITRQQRGGRFAIQTPQAHRLRKRVSGGTAILTFCRRKKTLDQLHCLDRAIVEFRSSLWQRADCAGVVLRSFAWRPRSRLHCFVGGLILRYAQIMTGASLIKSQVVVT